MKRILRSTREIKLMRRAGLLVWKAHKLVSDLVTPGVSTKELDQVVEDLFKQHDAIPAFSWVTPGENAISGGHLHFSE